MWNDYQLQWDEADYGGIAVLRLPPDKVWKPDIVLFNKYVLIMKSKSIFIYLNFVYFYYSADGNYEVRYKSNVLIYPNGEVLWVPPAIYQVSYMPFPFSCSLYLMLRHNYFRVHVP